MLLQCQFPVGLFDVLGRGVSLHIQDFVVIYHVLTAVGMGQGTREQQWEGAAGQQPGLLISCAAALMTVATPRTFLSPHNLLISKSTAISNLNDTFNASFAI